MAKGKTAQKNSGSTLAWVTITMVVLLIIVGGILTIASVYHERSVNNNAKSQSYYTARSGINAVLAHLIAYPKGDFATKLDALEPKKTLDLGAVNFGSGVSIGTCNLTVHKVGTSLYLKAQSTQGGMESTVVAELGKRKEKNNPLPFWNDFVYGATFGDGKGNKDLNNVTITSDPQEKGALFIGKDPEDTFYMRPNGNGRNLVTGNVYALRPLVVTSSEGKKEEGNEIGGTVVTDQPFVAENCYTILKGITSSSDVYTKDNKTFDVDLSGTGIIGNIDPNFKEWGSIAANTLRASGDVAIYGNITAKNVFLSENTIVNGNIEAEKVILSGNVKVNGNITASSISMSENVTVTGEVKSKELTVSLNKKDAVSVSAKVTTDTLILETDSSLEQYGKAVFNSDVLLRVFITKEKGVETPYNNPKDYPNKEVIATLIKGKFNTTNITYSKTIPSPKVNFPTPKPPVGVPRLENITPKNIDITGSLYSIALGEKDSDIDSYYLVKSSSNENARFEIDSVQGNAKVFLYVNDGITLNLDDVNYPTDSKAILFIIAEPGSTVNIHTKDEFYGYVWSKPDKIDPETNKVTKKGGIVNIYGNMKVRGGLFCEGSLDLGTDVNITYEALSDGVGSSGGSSESEKITWYLKQYFNDVPPLPKAGG